MDIAQVLARFDSLNIWQKAGQRAPHKPLLVLYALGRWQQGLTEVTFAEAEPALIALLREFGPPRKSDHPEQPFWRLQRDGIWVVRSPKKLPTKRGDSIPRVTALRSIPVVGMFSPDVTAALKADPSLVGQLAQRALDQHFPKSLHADILSAVGIELQLTNLRRTRDSSFRQRVLTAYEYRCAICGLDIRLGMMSIALDAAHIRWHQAGGPDSEANGLALCVLHHKVFDLGAFTLGVDGKVLVSDQINGTEGLETNLLRHHAKTFRAPQRPEWAPDPTHLHWHQREVFKGNARHA